MFPCLGAAYKYVSCVVCQVLLEAVLDTVRREALLERVTAVGAELQAGLEGLCVRFPGILSNARGRGTFCAIDCDTGARRDKLIALMRAQGVHLG